MKNYITTTASVAENVPEPLVSVVIPFYNEYLYLENAIYSILTQTHKNLEVLVVDDTGKHGAESIVAAIRDPRVKLLDYGENRGVSAARNFGLDNAQGDWVYFLDSDDFVSSRWLEKCLFAGLATGLPVCGIAWHWYDSDTVLARYGDHNNNDFAIFVMRQNNGTLIVGGHPQYMFLRKFLNDNTIRFIDGLVFGEDLVFFLEVAYHARLCALATGGGTYYCRPPARREKLRLYESQDCKKWADTLARFQEAIARLRVLYEQENFELEHRKDITDLMNMMTRRSRSKWQKQWRRFLACFIPNKKFRRKLRS